MLTNEQFVTIDWMQHQSSLNAFQAHIDSDGYVRAVISPSDPGVPNWLDTGGMREVFTILRWQALAAEPVQGEPAATLKMSTYDRLRNDLPTDTVWVDATQRQHLLEQRIAAYQRRITD
jgi:hypothetical protein